MLNHARKLLTTQLRHLLATKKAEGGTQPPQHQPPDIISDNLRFSTDKYNIYMVPKHPKVSSYMLKSIEVDPQSIVLELFFTSKEFQEVRVHAIQEELDAAFDKCSSMSLKFKHLGKLLDF
jgi:hypothetical protein